MRKLVIVAFMIIVGNSLFAQAVPQLNFGLGFNSGGGIPIYVSYDFPINNDISIAPLVQTDFNLDWITLGARGDYYFDRLLELPSDWDVYGGANLGYNIFFRDYGTNDLELGLQVGGRWRWNDMWALNLELAGGTSYGTKLGVTVSI